MSGTCDKITRLLCALERGEGGAIDELLPLVYHELRSRAGMLMASERRDHTLQRTALVHEAYLKLVGPGMGFQSRLHFFNAAGLAMRRILVDHASRRNTQKRGGGHARVEFTELDPVDESPEPMDWVELDEALKELEKVSSRQHQVVVLRFFSGRTEDEIAQMLGISEKTVRRDWATARVWLHRAMQKEN
jgi:RNA polymerase sigma factor (TIGR02999 family)